jgi:choice-of-anchor B domain-containing protein
MKTFSIGMITAVLILISGVYSSCLAQSQELHLLAHLNEYPSSGYSDCWGYTAPDGHEYALLGVDAGVSIVDITDTTNIAEVDFVPFVSYSWYDIKMYHNYMYVTSEGGHSLLVVDLSPLPAPASVVGQFTVFSSGPHNNFIDTETGILYGVEDQHYDPSLRIFDIASPGNPVELFTINTANNGTDSHDIFAQDSVLYIAEGFNPTIGIFDVSNPANPSLIQRLNIPAAGYVHQVWVTEDNKYMITTEETGGKTVKMWDIQNINNISLLGQYLGGSQLAHNAYIKRDYAYISHYESGLKVVDISDPNNITEVGYYDTYPQGETPNFHGAWGTYPFFSSGKILISDIETGLYVVYFEGAAEADALDPNPPKNVVAYSDYTTPTSMLLSWEDPTTYFGGDPLSPSDFTIEIERDQVQVASVAGGTQTYTDNGLTDGTLYEYTLYAKIIATDSISSTATASWYAGGSPIPSPPLNLVITSDGVGMLQAKWTNPSTNDDGTPLDDFDAINLYENGILLNTITQTPGDTGKADSVMFTPGGSNLPYYVTAVDNESPTNESATSNTVYPPFVAPYQEDFESATPGTPGTLPVQWTNETDDDIDWYVNEGGTPSNFTGPLVDHTLGTSAGNYMYTEASTPNFPNKVAHLTTPFIDLSTGSNPELIFWYHMYGAAMGELHVDVYDNGMWILDVMPPLVGQQQSNQNDPWKEAVVDLSAYAANPVQVRFRGITGTDYTSDMAIDDVHFSVTPTVIENQTGLPTTFALKANYPNPFNPSTTIAYQLPRQSDVRIEIYNLLGQKVRTLLNNRKEPGDYEAVWNGRNDSGVKVGSGVYMYRMVASDPSNGSAQDFVQVRKMILLK